MEGLLLCLHSCSDVAHSSAGCRWRQMEEAGEFPALDAEYQYDHRNQDQFAVRSSYMFTMVGSPSSPVSQV